MNYRVTSIVAPVVLGASLALAPTASAHNELISTNPAQGAQLTQVPATLDLTFNEGVLKMGNEIVVKAPNGNTSKPVTPQVIGPRVSVPFTPAGNGTYTVIWRVVSADGHPVGGSFIFSLKTAGNIGGNSVPSTSSTPTTNTSAGSAAASSAASAGTSASKESEAKSDSSGNAWKWILGGLLVVGLGCGAVVLQSRRTKDGGSVAHSGETDDE